MAAEESSGPDLEPDKAEESGDVDKDPEPDAGAGEDTADAGRAAALSGGEDGDDPGQDSQDAADVESTVSSATAGADKDESDAVSSSDNDSENDAPYPRRTTRRSSRSGGQGRGRGRGRSRRGRGRSKDEDGPDEDASEDEDDLGLRLGQRILQDLLNTNSTFLNYPEAKKGMVDYHDVIEKPMWFAEIQRRYENDEYTSVVDFVKDVRLLLLNAYRYFGPDALLTKRALRIEQVFECKLAGLPKGLRNQCSLMSTHGIKTNDEDDVPTARKSWDFFSHLLESVAGERKERERKKKNMLDEERILNKEGRGKDALQWESEVLLAPPAITQMKTMWEIPLIGHLVQLTVQVLCIEQIPQYEVERMFLIPQASKALAVLMTSLLSPPVQRTKLQQVPPMPYSIWSQKLSQRIAVWYKMFQTRNQDWSKIFELCGIEKDFWSILGDWNQLEDYEFHELSFHQRVWLVKSLCDYQVHNHKTMQDALADHSLQEQNCEHLGEDRHGRQYLHFPQLCSAPGLCTCVRVYRCVIPEEKARPPEPTEGTPTVRNGRGDFMPTWMRGRGRGKGKSGRGSQAARKKAGVLINNKKYLSRLVYRMPNGMHIRGRRKRGTNRLSDVTASIQQHNVKAEPNTSAPGMMLPPSCDQRSDSEDKPANIFEVKKEERRQTRSRRNMYQGFYADWSDSDSVSTPSPSSSISKRPSVQKRAFASLSTEVEKETLPSDSELDTSTAPNDKESSPKHSNESGSDNEDVTKSPDGGELSHESGCEDEASRSAWSTPACDKGDDCEEDSDDVDEEEKEEKSPIKKEDGDLDEFPWMPAPADNKLECKNKQKRPHYNPDWMLLGAKHFELVADSVQGIRDLIDSLCEGDDDVSLLQRQKNSATRPVCEEKLEFRLKELVDETDSLEVKMESNARKLRWKLFEEWEEFNNRPEGVPDEAETYWLNILNSGVDLPAVDVKIKVEKTESTEALKVSELEEQKSTENITEAQDEDSMTGYDIRHSLRAKKPIVDNPQQNWLNSDSEESESDEGDDAWVMPGKRNRKRPSGGRSKKNKKDAKSDEDLGDQENSKKSNDKASGTMKNFSFESGGVDREPSQTDNKAQKGPQDKPKMNQRLLPNKLTLDKEGNMFITLGCGTKVSLEKDSEGRIIVPEGHEGLSMIRGKTLEQLVGSGKVVQNRKRKVKSAKSLSLQQEDYSEIRRMNHSTTLFPALPPPGGIVQAKEWTPPVVRDNVQAKGLNKHLSGTSVQAKEWTPPLEKKLAPSVTVSSTLGATSQPAVKTYANRSRKVQPKQVPEKRAFISSSVKKSTQPEEVVVLSDGSDDSIEVIKETEPKGSVQKAGPRIQSVVGNAKVDSFAPKPLTNSVTMTPVIVAKKQSPKRNPKKSKQWSPVISNTVSLEPVSASGRISNTVSLEPVSASGRISNAVSLAPGGSSGRVPAPGAPQVVITPAKNVQARRNLQQTGVFHQPTPNQSFVPVSAFPVRQSQAQQQFVPMNQMVPIANQFQPVTQVVGMNNQYIVSNSTFPHIGNSYVLNTPTYQYVPVAPVPQGPLPLPVSAFDIGLPPGLTGQIVLANADNNQFSYAFKLDDGGLIFLTNDQVSKIRAANGGKLTTMVQFQTH